MASAKDHKNYITTRWGTDGWDHKANGAPVNTVSPPVSAHEASVQDVKIGSAEAASGRSTRSSSRRTAGHLGHFSASEWCYKYFQIFLFTISDFGIEAYYTI